MTTPCPGCGLKSLQIRENLSSTEESEMQRQLRSEFGPFVVDLKRAEELKEMLAQADKDIEYHDSEVARLYLAMKVEKQRLERQRTQIRALLSPIRKLPNEMLLSIFEYVCEQTPNEIPSSLRDITVCPTMAISSVCFRWRELALSSPGLWTNLNVEIDGNYSSTVSNTVTRYLERSGDCPLTLRLSVWGTGHITEVPAITSLTQHVHRWKTFNSWRNRSLTDYKILSQLRFPSLAALDISSRDLDLFELCPRLRALTISDWPTGPKPKILHNQLDHLDFRGSSLTDLAEALRAWPSLRSLELDRIGGHYPEGTLGTWYNITSLTLRDGPSSGSVFSLLNFPSLNKLAILSSSRMGWTANAFASFISRSSCMITTFTIHYLIMSDLELIAALRVLPTLLHLEVHCFDLHKSQVPISSSLISSLTHQSTSISLVPKLHSLYLECQYPADAFDDSAFVNMVQSRWVKPGSDLSAEMLTMGRSCIRSVVLKFTKRQLDAAIYKPLRILDAEGLRVVVAGANGVQV